MGAPESRAVCRAARGEYEHAACHRAVRLDQEERSEADGATLLLTSHDTGDIERVCERAIVIHAGRLLWDGSLRELRRKYLAAKFARGLRRYASGSRVNATPLL